MKLLPIILTAIFQTFIGYISPAQQLNIYKYTIQNGLVNNDVLQIYQDSQGFMWICTRGGLSRYDGTRFTNYTTDNGLTNDMINDIYEVAPQEFIIAQNMNGPRLLKNGKIGPLNPKSNITINNFYRSPDKRLLVSTDFNGIMELKENALHPINPKFSMGASELTIINDSIWLVHQTLHSIQLVTPSLLSYSPRSTLLSTMVHTDSRHRTWLGTTKGLLLLSSVHQRNKNIQFIPLPPAFNLPILKNNPITAFMEDSQNNTWICTVSGLVLIRPNGTSTIFNELNGLPASSINCIVEDRQNNIWIGTPLGLAKFSVQNEVKIFTQKDGLPILGSVFISPVTTSRLRLFELERMTEMDLPAGEFYQHVVRDGSTYIPSKISKEEILLMKDRETNVYMRGKHKAKVIQFPSHAFDYVKRIDADKFVGAKGSSMFLILKSQIKDTLTLFGKSHIVHLQRYKKDFLLAGTFDSGLFKIRVAKDSLQLIDSFSNVLPDMSIRTLFVDKENEIWIGTRYQGIIRLLESGSGKYEMQQYGKLQGLSSDFVRTINRDKKGNIWVGTMQGIDKLIPDENKYRIFNFGKINNIFSQVFDICFLEDDQLLAAGYPYLAYARDIQLDTISPQIACITKIEGEFKNDSLSESEGISRLPYNKAQIYFEFSVPQFINEEFTQLGYRLLGNNDTNWTMAVNSRSVSFASLKPGNYNFEVRAFGFNGKWGPASSHHFIVATPYWQKGWFISLIIVAAVSFIYGLYRYRIHQLVRLQKVRSRIASDLHDEIGSSLTNISILSSLSKKNILNPKEATEFLQRISEEVSSSSQALDDIIWSVNSNHDTLDETVSRMRRYAAELFDVANIQYELNFDRIFEETKLIMEQRRDIYLLYKEAVNNIFKHADAKQVSIKISIKHSALLLDITDDGKGFDINKASEQHGLIGMKTRVNKWKGKIQIKSTENKGTSIHCSIPLKG